MKPANFKVILILTIAIFAVSTSAIWIRLAMQTANNYTVGFSIFLAASRLIFSALILLPNSYKIKTNSTNDKAYYWAIIAGICLAGHFASWISSLAFTSIAASTTLVTTNPIWVGLLSRFLFREKLSKLTIIGIGISFAGGFLIALNNGDINSGSLTTYSNIEES